MFPNTILGYMCMCVCGGGGGGGGKGLEYYSESKSHYNNWAMYADNKFSAYQPTMKANTKQN